MQCQDHFLHQLMLHPLLLLRAAYVAAGKISHDRLFFLETAAQSAIRKSRAGAGMRAYRNLVSVSAVRITRDTLRSLGH
jgi:hypothetical protein